MEDYRSNTDIATDHILSDDDKQLIWTCLCDPDLTDFLKLLVIQNFSAKVNGQAYRVGT